MATQGGTRRWLRKWRVHLMLAPLVLAVGLGFNAYESVTGNDDNPTKPVDVAKGQVGEYQGLSIELTKFERKRPSGFTASSFPKGSAVFVATFRGRIDDPKKAKKIFCESTIEAPDGWEWDSTTVSSPLIPENMPTTCEGKPLFGKAPRPGQWYTFAQGYAVPKERAKQQLRPTLSYYKEYPRYLRFET